MAGRDVSLLRQKETLRRDVRRRRDALPLEEIEAGSALIARRVMDLAGYQRSRTRLLFVSYGSEVRTGRLLRETLRSRGTRLILPRVLGMEEPLALHEVRDLETDLSVGYSGIPEPVPARCPECSIYDIDFALVPGLAFDRRGGRLGYGGGFFDYILSLRSDLVESGAAVAVAFAIQIVAEVPLESWDMRVPIVVTEDGLIDTRRGRS